jgi:hypothetical protein
LFEQEFELSAFRDLGKYGLLNNAVDNPLVGASTAPNSGANVIIASALII